MNIKEILDNIVLAADRAGYDGPYPCPTCKKHYYGHQYSELEVEERKRLYTHILVCKMYKLTCLKCSEARAAAEM